MLIRLLFPRAALWILLTLVGSMLFPDPAASESYIAGQFGVTLASELTDGNLTSHGLSGLQVSDQDLKSSLMGGIKLGHYFTKARWLGIETELFYTTPHIKQGTLTFSGPGGSVSGEFLGLHHRMLTWAPVNIVIRYPYYRLQPYAAIGPACSSAGSRIRNQDCLSPAPRSGSIRKSGSSISSPGNGSSSPNGNTISHGWVIRHRMTTRTRRSDFVPPTAYTWLPSVSDTTFSRILKKSGSHLMIC